VYEAYGTGLFGYRTVHDFWLHLAGETGVVGVTIFLTLIAGLLIRFVRAARSAIGERFVVLAGTATMLIVASLNSVTEMIFEGNMPSVLIWLMVGLASCLAPAWTSTGAEEAADSS
jgi:O-antigen ligase